MTDHTGLEERLSAMFEVMGDWAPHDPDLLDTVRRRAGWRWPTPRLVAVVAAAAVVAATAVSVPLLTRDDNEPQPAHYTCGELADPRDLPEWTGAIPVAPAPFVLGTKGLVVGQVDSPLGFGSSESNAVGWLLREGSGPITISARLVPDSPPVVREAEAQVGSMLDLPAPGCWHLDLTWGENGEYTDSVNLSLADTTVVGAATGPCTAGGGEGARPGLAWREPLDWAAVVDHVVELTVVGLPPGTVQNPDPAELSVDVDRILWSRPGAADLPDDLTLNVIACSVAEPGTTSPEANWWSDHRYVAAVLHLPADADLPEELPDRWAPLSPGSVFTYDEGVLDTRKYLFLDSTWEQRLRGKPASALVDVLRQAEREHADLLAKAHQYADPFRRSDVVRDH
jgi:hypothetical protein